MSAIGRTVVRMAMICMAAGRRLGIALEMCFVMKVVRFEL
jgi:hypothetical protein